MPEVAKLLISSKLINTVGKCAYKGDGAPLLSQMYILVYDHKVMIAALDGLCLAMRKFMYDTDGMKFEEIDEAENKYKDALYAIGNRSWMFPADLKIPPNMNTTITLYEDFSVVLQTKNAVYGPFGKIDTLNGTEKLFEILSIFKYPHGRIGSSRVFCPARISKLVCALGEKRDALIFNTSGGSSAPLYIKSVDGNAYGMVIPMKDFDKISEEFDEPDESEEYEETEEAEDTKE